MRNNQKQQRRLVTAVMFVLLTASPQSWSPLPAVLAVDANEEETMTIEGQLQFPDKTPFVNRTTRISVNHGEYTTYSRASTGDFTIHNIPPGIYAIDVHSSEFHFAHVRCQFKPENKNNDDKKPVFGCFEYAYPGAPKQAVPDDQGQKLTITAYAVVDYFEVRKGFSILSILKNPMILMMLFTVGLMYYMPKLMEGMDPEERKQMQKQMEMQQNPTKMLGELFGGGGSTEPEPTKRKIKK